MGRPRSLRSKVAHFGLISLLDCSTPFLTNPPNPLLLLLLKMWMGPEEVKMEQ
ncbi:hypothetical protein ABKV19_007894 [Rosa sericea]